MRESTIERYLVQQVKKRGGRAYKWVSPGNRGVPDRIVVFPNSRVHFVELKAPNKKLRPDQERQARWLREAGQHVWMLDCKQSVDNFLWAVCY